MEKWYETNIIVQIQSSLVGVSGILGSSQGELDTCGGGFWSPWMCSIYGHTKRFKGKNGVLGCGAAQTKRLDF